MLASALPVPLIAAAAGQRQVLDVGAERVGDRGLHGVGAGTAALSVTTSPALSTT